MNPEIYTTWDIIKERIEQNYYENKIPYKRIKKPLKPRVDLESKFYLSVMEEFESKSKAYAEHWAVYQKGRNAADTLFRNYLLKYIFLYVKTEKQAEKIFNMAYDKYSSEGKQSVLDGVEELCSLFIE